MISEDLASFLEQYRGAGEISSNGVFTVDIAKALPKLEKFQLPEPHFGLLKVVQSAVASQATDIRLYFGPRSIVIEHNGKPPSAAGLRGLLNHLMARDQPIEHRILRDLAIGVNTTLARGANWVEVCAKQEDGWLRQRWVSRQETEEKELSQRAFAGNTTVRFEMRRTVRQAASELVRLGGSLAGVMRRNRDALDRDAKAVYDRCRYAPVKLSINGKRLPPGAFGGIVVKRWSIFHLKQHRRPNLLDFYLVDPKDSPHLMSRPSHSPARYGFKVPVRPQDDGLQLAGEVELCETGETLERRCWGWVGVRNRPNIPFISTVVKDGVELTSLAPSQLHLPKGVSAVMVAEGLPLDLSQFRLVKSPELNRRLHWIARMVKEASSAALEHPALRELSAEQRANLKRLADH